jgi:hypothetical protein
MNMQGWEKEHVRCAVINCAGYVTTTIRIIHIKTWTNELYQVPEHFYPKSSNHINKNKHINKNNNISNNNNSNKVALISGTQNNHQF